MKSTQVLRPTPARTVAALLCLLLLLTVSCGKKDEQRSGETAARSERSDATLKVGLVFDVGGRGDKSFNDSAYRGLEKARDELGIAFEYIEPGEGADRESALRLLASGDAEIIFGIGFLFTDDITAIAKDFPDKKFACVDYSVTPGQVIPPNLLALKFREEEASFLVGAIAALESETDKVGFVGGMKIPLIKKFEAGYVAGAKYVNPRIEVLVAYAGVTANAFKNPSKGKELALSQYSKGADIIFHASGSTGLGVFEAARERGTYAIGVDSDQYDEAPGRVLTSMIKDVDVAVYRAIESVLDGTFEGGVKTLGLAEGAVSFVYDDNNKELIKDSTLERIQHLKEKIISGEIIVPSS